MDEVKTNKVENLPVLDEVPEGATLIAEVDGEFYRVKGEGVGGEAGKEKVVLTSTFDSESGEEVLGINVSYTDLKAMIQQYLAERKSPSGRMEWYSGSTLCGIGTPMSFYIDLEVEDPDIFITVGGRYLGYSPDGQLFWG